MKKSQSISWQRHEELEEYISHLDFDRSKEGRERRELLQRFLEADNIEKLQALNNEAGGITQEEMDEFMDKIHIADMTLGDLKNLFSVIQNIYRHGRQEYEVWKAKR